MHEPFCTKSSAHLAHPQHPRTAGAFAPDQAGGGEEAAERVARAWGGIPLPQRRLHPQPPHGAGCMAGFQRQQCPGVGAQARHLTGLGV